MEPLSGVVFKGSMDTIREAEDRMLLGASADNFGVVNRVRPGTKVYLLDVASGRLHGGLEAASEGRRNIEATAWTGSAAPAQVRLRRVRGAQRPLSRQHWLPVLRAVLLDAEVGDPRKVLPLYAQQVRQLDALLTGKQLRESDSESESQQQQQELQQKKEEEEEEEEQLLQLEHENQQHLGEHKQPLRTRKQRQSSPSRLAQVQMQGQGQDVQQQKQKEEETQGEHGEQEEKGHPQHQIQQQQHAQEQQQQPTEPPAWLDVDNPESQHPAGSPSLVPQAVSMTALCADDAGSLASTSKVDGISSAGSWSGDSDEEVASGASMSGISSSSPSMSVSSALAPAPASAASAHGSCSSWAASCS